VIPANHARRNVCGSVPTSNVQITVMKYVIGQDAESIVRKLYNVVIGVQGTAENHVRIPVSNVNPRYTY
jgi:hypothetical protein